MLSNRDRHEWSVYTQSNSWEWAKAGRRKKGRTKARDLARTVNMKKEKGKSTLSACAVDNNKDCQKGINEKHELDIVLVLVRKRDNRDP